MTFYILLTFIFSVGVIILSIFSIKMAMANIRATEKACAELDKYLNED